MSSSEGFSYVIGGVRVNFPFKPYPSQMAMMAQIIKGLQKRQNCLIESPTGSGKSLALLCSTIAWLEAEEDRIQRYNSLIDQGITDPDVLGQIIRPPVQAQSNTTAEAPSRPTPPTTAPVAPTPAPVAPTPPRIPTLNEMMATPATPDVKVPSQQEGGFIRDDADDFKEPTTRFRIRDESGDVTVVDESIDALRNGFIALDDTVILGDLNDTGALQAPPTPRKMRAPKIFFGTRTHKQIYQITKELRRTKYKHVKSCVLGSREHTCIHPTVSVSSNKNELCRALRDNKNMQEGFCMYDHGVNRISTHEQIHSFGIRDAWDLEDLVKVGKKVKACPYYASRQLMETAQLIICPYNYLIDPLIRSNMNISLFGNILILDEAHNVEDSAREASSVSLTQPEILDSMNDLEQLIRTDQCNISSCKSLITVLTNLSNWMEANGDKLTDYSEFGRTGKIFTGKEMIKTLDNFYIGPASLKELEGCLSDLNQDPEKDEESIPKPTSATSQLFKGLFLILQYLFKDGMKYADDYKIALVKSQVFGKASKKMGKNTVDGWISAKKTPNMIYSLNFWCLNPGVSFSELGVLARSIILTSGTLSPMNSFESELQVKFDVQLEANHVISKNQVWVGTISRGPMNQTLNATYKHAETWAFQDELGRLVLDICETVPRGVLCFFPSYSMLDKLMTRWKDTDIWEDIQKRKHIITEPRKVDEFEASMKLFYSHIKETREIGEDGIDGVLFMAVCRGKVSEGLDFTDDNARAVIAVGIPFPNIKDIQVDLKKQYNNTFHKNRGLLSGIQWYEIQAYRALNQALGRCIRHRYDWGALILVDERYQQGWGGDKYVKGLSKWVRNNLHHHRTCKEAISNLKSFAEEMVQNPPQSPYDSAPEGEKNSPIGLLGMPKPKFASPPQSFSKFVENRENSNEKELKPKFTFTEKLGAKSNSKGESPILAIPNLLHLNDDAENPSPVILVTPRKSEDSLTLTPIPGGFNNFLSSQSGDRTETSTPAELGIGSNQLIFPLSSTQVSSLNSQLPKGSQMIGFINIQNTEGNSDQKSYNTNSQLFHRISIKSPQNDTLNKKPNVKPLAMSFMSPHNSLKKPKVSYSPNKNPDAEDSIHVSSENDSLDENLELSEKPRNNCSAYFKTTDSHNMTPSSKRKLDESKQYVNSSLKSTSRMQNKVSPKPDAKSQISKQVSEAKVNHTQISDFRDSDLEDFQLETSTTQVVRRVSRGRRFGCRKGVNFTEFD